MAARARLMVSDRHSYQGVAILMDAPDRQPGRLQFTFSIFDVLFERSHEMLVGPAAENAHREHMIFNYCRFQERLQKSIFGWGKTHQVFTDQKRSAEIILLERSAANRAAFHQLVSPVSQRDGRDGKDGNKHRENLAFLHQKITSNKKAKKVE